MYSLIVLLAPAACLYIAFVIILVRALERIRRAVPAASEKTPQVTVVVAAHNERRTIGLCLASLMKQYYPQERYNVIVADDRSDDGTSEVLGRFTEIWDALTVIRIDDVPPGISPKKHALAQAIGRASGDIILQTDADCVVPPRWIEGMTRGFAPGVGMVAGVAPYLPAHSILNAFVRHEYVWNAALAAGSIALGHPTHASGRNLAFRRDMFREIDGYGDRRGVLSGDDTLLLRNMVKHSKYRAAYMTDILTHVFTQAPRGFRAFLRQRVRHMSTGKYFDPVQIAAGIAVYGFHILLVVLGAYALYYRQALIVFGAVFMAKLVVDTWMFRRAQEILGLDIQGSGFLVNEIYHMVYLAVLPLFGLVVPVRWKERGR